MEKIFVSRAGQKLQYALDYFKIDLKDKICADLGSSTGGFTDCLLQNGASKVYTVDTAYGELDWKLRNDPRVIVMEKTNALYLALPEKVDFISIDVGWTPQKKILPHAIQLLKEDGEIISLLKLHYEAQKYWLRHGTLKEEFIEPTIEKVKKELLDLGIGINGIVKSPIFGSKGGNIEYLILIKKLQ